MSIEGKKIDAINLDDMSDGLNCVRQSLIKFQDEFYRGLLGIPGINLSDLTLVTPYDEGIRDDFLTGINYYFYPWLFSDAFQKIDKKKSEKLCFISQLGAESLIQMDKIMDDQLISSKDIMQFIVLLGYQYKFAISLKELAKLFGDNESFWSKFELLFVDYMHQLLKERADNTTKPMSLLEFEKSAAGKAALAKIITVAMGELADRTEIVPMIERSQDLFSIGYQLYDDIKDWEIDFKRGQYSYFLKKVIDEFSLIHEIANGSIPNINDLKAHIYLSDVIIESLELAASYLDSAKEPISTIECPKWKSWIEKCKKSILRFRSDLLEIRNKTIDNIK